MATDYDDGPHRPDTVRAPSGNPGMDGSYVGQSKAAQVRFEQNSDALERGRASASLEDTSQTATQHDIKAARASLDDDQGAGQVRDPQEAIEARRALDQDYREAGKEATGLDVKRARTELDSTDSQVTVTMETDRDRGLGL